jgi:hypothetical protein
MPEASGGAVGSSTPSNGASSTTPAPGAVTQTPKGGEGTVPEAPKAPSFLYKGKLKLGDKEEDVEIPDEATLHRKLVAAKAVDRYSKEAVALRKQLSDLDVRRKRGDVLDTDEAKDAYFQKRLEHEARMAQMPDAERAKAENDQRIQQAEARAKAAEARAQAIINEQLETRAWAELEPRLKSAMQQHEMIGDTHAMEMVERVAQEFMEAGVDATPEVVVQEAAARDKERFVSRIPGMKADVLWKHLTDEQRMGLQALAIEAWKAKRSNIPKPVEPPPQVNREAEKPKERPSGMSVRDWMRTL